VTFFYSSSSPFCVLSIVVDSALHWNFVRINAGSASDFFKELAVFGNGHINI
jgi:hypothetical protein